MLQVQHTENLFSFSASAFPHWVISWSGVYVGQRKAPRTLPPNKDKLWWSFFHNVALRFYAPWQCWHQSVSLLRIYSVCTNYQSKTQLMNILALPANNKLSTCEPAGLLSRSGMRLRQDFPALQFFQLSPLTLWYPLVTKIPQKHNGCLMWKHSYLFCLSRPLTVLGYAYVFEMHVTFRCKLD